MLFITKESFDWLRQHGTYWSEHGWYCRICATRLELTTIDHTVGGNPGKLEPILPVQHYHCPVCQPDWQKPTQFSIVSMEEVVDIETDPTAT